MTEAFDFQAFPVLESERLLLREMSGDDAPTLFEYFRDPEYTRYVSFEVHSSPEQTKDFITWMADLYQRQDSIRWGIQLKETGGLIGTIGLHFLRRDIRCMEVGYHIGRSYWRRGFATEALRTVVDFGFRDMNLNRIEATHHAGNEASGRVMQKVGFRYEGIWRQRAYKHGSLVDTVWYSLLREEYLLG
jgi:ribosomal-protein-alanine N-acetyltransferase